MNLQQINDFSRTHWISHLSGDKWQSWGRIDTSREIQEPSTCLCVKEATADHKRSVGSLNYKFLRIAGAKMQNSWRLRHREVLTFSSHGKGRNWREFNCGTCWGTCWASSHYKVYPGSSPLLNKKYSLCRWKVEFHLTQEKGALPSLNLSISPKGSWKSLHLHGRVSQGQTENTGWCSLHQGRKWWLESLHPGGGQKHILAKTKSPNMGPIYTPEMKI